MKVTQLRPTKVTRMNDSCKLKHENDACLCLKLKVVMLCSLIPSLITICYINMFIIMYHSCVLLCLSFVVRMNKMFECEIFLYYYFNPFIYICTQWF